ncbi:hypothetical protein R1sor_001051 [Riccia sorocarpa]|uniref:FAD/NAD(P)-binding domain-containing protein n=1 Tax=Riccia sorocarpa TaxID=122646 RepID=A0ABD3H0W6_9MARC
MSKTLSHVNGFDVNSRKEFLEIPYAEPRSVVEPSFADRMLIPHTEYLKQARVILGSAERASVTELVTDTGEVVSYDFLVITTGSTFRGVKTKAERIEEFQKDNKKIVNAETLLVVGGGPVGVELAAEIVTDFPEKKVKLVHGGDRLIGFLGQKASAKTEKWLKDRGVDVILKERINLDQLSPPDYVTASLKPVKADAHFLAVGKKLGSDWLQASPFLKHRVTTEGRLRMEPTTQVAWLKNVFAAGDITDFKEIKQGFTATNQAKIVIQNIRKLIKNPEETKLSVYKPLEKPMGIVTLGRVDAVAQLPFLTIIGWVPGLLKSKDLFVGKVRQDLGLKY